MFHNIYIQWKLRKTDILLFDGIMLGLLLMGQMFVALVAEFTEESIRNFYVGMFAWLIFYLFGRLISTFYTENYMKEMFLGFSGTRKGFASSLLVITFLQYVVMSICYFFIQFLSGAIWRMRSDVPLNGGPIAVKYFIFAAIALPFLELLIGMCYDRFGVKAIVFIFVLQGFACFLFSERLEGFRNILSNVFFMLPIMVNFGIIFIVIVALDFLLVKKCSIHN